MTVLLAKLTGGPSRTSVSMGFGMFYNPIEQLVLEQFSAEPPFGGSNFIGSSFLQILTWIRPAPSLPIPLPGFSIQSGDRPSIGPTLRAAFILDNFLRTCGLNIRTNTT